MENTKENQDLVSKMSREYIRKNDIERLNTTLNLENEVNLPVDLSLEGHNLCGTHFLEKKEYFQAIPHLNKSRSIDFNNKDISKKCLLALLGFYNQNEDKFSLNDLKKLEATFLHFTKQVELHISNADFLKEIPAVFDSIKLHRLVAEDLIESPMTFRVDNVFNAYYQPKTYNDVLENFAFAIENDLRDFYDEEKKKSENPTKKKEKQSKKKKDKPKDQE